MGKDRTSHNGQSPLQQVGSDQPAPGLEALNTAARCVRGPSGWLYDELSLGIWPPYEQPRRTCIHIIEFPGFETFIALTIFCNVATMAIQSPLDPPGTQRANFIDMLESVYLAIFTTELCLKVVAYGFVGHSHAYLRNSWCQVPSTSTASDSKKAIVSVSICPACQPCTHRMAAAFPSMIAPSIVLSALPLTTLSTC